MLRAHPANRPVRRRPLARRPSYGRRGAVVVYAILVLVVLLLMSTLAVDWGRAQLTKTELQAAADSAARYGVNGLKTGASTAISQAQYAAALNQADGRSVALDATKDVELGTWDPGGRTFEALTGTARASATAVRVTARRTKVNSNPIPLTFGKAVGVASTDVLAVSVATRGTITTESVIAKSCPWLAGMPDGSTVDAYDDNTQGCVAPENSPKSISSIPIVPGGSLYFRQTTGTTSYSNASNYGPDGQTDWIVRQRAANGINPTSAPLNCLVGIFLDDRAPNTYAAAAELDFSTSTSRDFTSLSPKIKQVFFIGDGLDSQGRLQEFKVPTGATRFYMALMDEKGWWWDNTGQLQTTMLNDTVTMVK